MQVHEILTRQNELGLNLDSHLQELYLNFYSDKENPKTYEDFQKISKNIKKQQFLFSNKKKSQQIIQNENYQLFKNYLKFNSKYENVSYENISQKFELLKIAKISLHQSTCFLLQQQIYQLSFQYPSFKFSYFGLIFTQKEDYHIFYAENKNQKEFSINDLKIFCSQNFTSWKELKSITPKDMRISRKIKRIFTGNLLNKIENIDEEIYLKCTIIRILFTNQIIPEGLLEPNDQNDREYQKNADFILEKEKFLNLETWVYKYPKILINGETHYKSIKNEEILLKLEEDQKIPNILTPILENEKRIWIKKKFGSKDKIQIEENTLSLNTITIFNTDYPEAINYYNEQLENFGFFYKGYGIKKKQKILLEKTKKISPETKFRDNREKGEPNPPEENSDIMETDSDPEETENQFNFKITTVII